MTDHVAHAGARDFGIPAAGMACPDGPRSHCALHVWREGRYRFGEPGSPITWTGEYDGKQFQDKDEILETVPAERLRVTHFSPFTGQDDVPENYHMLHYRLTDVGESTRVTLDQSGNDSEEQAAQIPSNWQMMLNQLKDYVEDGSGVSARPSVNRQGTLTSPGGAKETSEPLGVCYPPKTLGQACPRT